MPDLLILIRFYEAMFYKLLFNCGRRWLESSSRITLHKETPCLNTDRLNCYLLIT